MANSEDGAAHFPGGDEALQNYLDMHKTYLNRAVNNQTGVGSLQHFLKPNSSATSNKSGKVRISFVVEENGELTHVRICRGASPELNAEALRAVYGMPNWVPEMHAGTASRSKEHLVVEF